MLNKLSIKAVSTLTVALLLCVGFLAACGGSSGIPDGKYESDGTGSFSYLDFKSGKVEVGVGVGGTTISAGIVKYTFKDSTLSFSVGGVPYVLPCSIDGDILSVGTDKYYNGGAPINVAVSESDGGNVPVNAKQENAHLDETNGRYNGAYINISGDGEITITENIVSGLKDIYGNPTEYFVSAEGTLEGPYNKVERKEDSYFIGSNEYVLQGGKSYREHRIDEIIQDNKLSDISLKHEPAYYTTLGGTYGGTIGVAIEDGDAYFYKNNSTGTFGHAETPAIKGVKSLYGNYGEDVVFFLTNANELLGMGKNSEGQLGDGTGVDKGSPKYGKYVDPIKITENVMDIWYDGKKIYCFKTDDSLWRWGAFPTKIYSPELTERDVAEIIKINEYNKEFEATYLKTNGDLVSKGVLLLSRVKSYYAGKGNEAYIKFSNDTVYHFPYLFDNDIFRVYESEKVFDDVKSLNTIDYGRFVWVVLNTGELYAKGSNSNGQFGDGTKIDKDGWVKIADDVVEYGLDYKGSHDTAEDDRDYYYVKTDGSVWGWTKNDPTQKEIVLVNTAETSNP